MVAYILAIACSDYVLYLCGYLDCVLVQCTEIAAEAKIDLIRFGWSNEKVTGIIVKRRLP